MVMNNRWSHATLLDHGDIMYSTSKRGSIAVR